MSARFAFVVSTSGSVLHRVLHAPLVKSVTHLVVADRACGAIDVAADHGVESVVLESTGVADFCDQLERQLEAHRIDFVVSFYTNFYSDDFRARYRDRIVNFHPSLLPAFKGMDGFGDGFRYHAKILGSTVELIKDVMDEGKIVLQTAFAVDPDQSFDTLRHRLFEQQCRSLIQVVKWLDDGRVRVDGDRVRVAGAVVNGLEFVPALDFAEAIELNIPPPPDS